MLFLVSNATGLAAGPFLGVATDRFGPKGPLVVGTAAIAIGLAAVSRASSFAALAAPLACLGLGSMALNGGGNTLVADLHDDPSRKAAALNFIGVFYGVGAVMLPFSLGLLLATVGVPNLLLTSAGFAAVLLAAVVVLRFPEPKPHRRASLAESLSFLRTPAALTLAGLVYFQIGNEFILAGYFASFVTREFHAPVTTASYLLACYWGSMMVGRIVFSRLMLRFEQHGVLVVTCLAAAASAGVLSRSVGPVSAAIAVVCTGFALSGTVPTVLAIAGARFRERSGTVNGVLFSVAALAGMTVPSLAGVLGDWAGLRAVWLLVAAQFVVAAAFVYASRRIGEARPTAN